MPDGMGVSLEIRLHTSGCKCPPIRGREQKRTFLHPRVNCETSADIYFATKANQWPVQWLSVLQPLSVQHDQICRRCSVTGNVVPTLWDRVGVVLPCAQ